MRTSFIGMFAIAAAGVFAVMRRMRRSKFERPDVGAVSEYWIAQQRASQSDY